MADSEKNKITGPFDPTIDGFVFYNMPLLICADLIEGGQLMFVGLTDLVSKPVPGLRCPPGSMIVMIPADIAAQIRGQMKTQQADHMKKKGLIVQ